VQIHGFICSFSLDLFAGRWLNVLNVNAMQNAKTTEDAMPRTPRTTTSDELVRQIERCLAELRQLGHRNRPRRRVVQARYAALSQQMRRPYGV